jgi:hypothetical protein
MSRLDDFESIITGDGNRSISGTDPVDSWVLKVVAHAGFADENYAQEEFDVLERIMPDKDVGEIMDFMVAESERPLDLQALKAAITSVGDRGALVRIAQHLIAADREVKPAEERFVADLKTALGS